MIKGVPYFFLSKIWVPKPLIFRNAKNCFVKMGHSQILNTCESQTTGPKNLKYGLK